MKKRLRVALLFGGKSAEHEISLISARNIFQAMDKNKYDALAVAIDKHGRWSVDEGERLLRDATLSKVDSTATRQSAAVLPGETATPIVRASSGKTLAGVDVVFPVLHGPFGEDGTVQGLLKLAGVPFVGSGILGSAVGMDKEVMKRLLREADLPVGPFLAFRAHHANLNFADVAGKLGLPLFVKPANLGSSVGVNKVTSEDDFRHAVAEAFAYDRKILVEAFIEGREIECSVLGNDDPIASIPGEVISTHAFYSYEAKYIDENGATLEIPAKVSEATARTIQDLAV